MRKVKIFNELKEALLDVRRKKKAAKIRAPLRRDPAARLLDEVGRYLKAVGGQGLVAGPIRIVDWPEDVERNVRAPTHMQFFAVDVKVMGRRPDARPDRKKEHRP